MGNGPVRSRTATSWTTLTVDARLPAGHRGDEGRRADRRAGVRHAGPAVDADPGGVVKHLQRHRAVLVQHRLRRRWTSRGRSRTTTRTATSGSTRATRWTAIVDEYERECERSRAAIAGADLGDMAKGADMTFNLRYALAHMIEETARHCGHLDLLRETTDGRTGQ